MSPAVLFRIAARSSAQSLVRPRCTAAPLPRLLKPFVSSNLPSISCSSFSTSSRRTSSHAEETFEEFSVRFIKEFEKVNDVFELQRNLNNAFAYDLVPSPEVIRAALEACRRVNDFPTSVRIFAGIRNKVENKGQYEQYLEELKDIRESLGIILVEDFYPNKRDQ